jgi:tripartite-type tricarboxylate transporter receptor subunit TctC
VLPQFTTPDSFAETIRRDRAAYAEIVKSAGLTFQ